MSRIDKVRLKHQLFNLAFDLIRLIADLLLQIAHDDFPVPRIPQPPVASHPPSAPEPHFLAPLPPSSISDPAEAGPSAENEPAVSSPTGSSQETNKENAAPPKAPTPEPAPAIALALDPGALPPQITAMLAEITGVLTETFHTYPPHTIQRLAELVLQPRRHYKSLPAYLHAVDRVVHVTSGNNIYPLPPAVPDMSHMMINGVTEGPGQDSSASDGQAAWASTSSSTATAVGSDEALGGALLTPIPWLARRATNGDPGSESGGSPTLGSESGPSPLTANQGTVASQQRQTQGRQYEMQVQTESTETIEGPNGMGRIETVTVSVNGLTPLSPATQQRVITQGELIRQEQRAGVVPVSQLARTGSIVVTTSSEPVPIAAEAETSDAAMAEAEAVGEGEGEVPKDISSEKSDEDMADEDDFPHARGPDIIGAADMGPQTPSSSTFSISSGGNVEVRGIDVEAAVGRKHEAAPIASSATTQSESSDEGAAITPASSEAEGAAVTDQTETTGSHDQESNDHEAEKDGESNEEEATSAALSSPIRGKREAEDDIAETESVSSKRRKATPDEDDEALVTEPSPAEPAEKAEQEPESTGEQAKDAEGDIVISDEAAPSSDAKPAPTAEDTGTDAGKEGDEENKIIAMGDEANPSESTD